jgi:hypothetical protein
MREFVVGGMWGVGLDIVLVISDTHAIEKEKRNPKPPNPKQIEVGCNKLVVLFCIKATYHGIR